MLVIQTLRWVLLIVEGAIALPLFYLCIVSISAILSARQRKKRGIVFSPPYADFAILIPAHDEITVLGTLLDSLAALDYPAAHYAVFLVADNCTDTTAELARSSGFIRVYERFDQKRHGKGFALHWLFQQLEKDQLIADAYIVLDADSVVDSAFLQALNYGLAQGAQALQAHNTVLNVADSPSTALRWLALTLINHVRPLGRNGLGYSSTLTGNGMCLSRALLQRCPWQAFGLTEDYQYYLTLVQNGEKVTYMPEALVRSEMPATFAQMRTQDIRWEADQGRQSSWKISWQLLKAGISHRDFARIEAIAELLTPPLSSLAGCCFLTCLAALLLAWFPGLLVSLLLMVGLICYLGTAIYLLRPPRTLFMAFLHAPGFILWKLWVILVVRRSKKYSKEWIRTRRAKEGENSTVRL